MFKILLALATYGEMAAAAKTEGTGRSLIPAYKEMKEEGDSIVGKLVARRELSGANEGKYTQYTFETDEGLCEFHCGAYFDGHAGVLMGEGGVYEITFEGKVKIEGTNRNVNRFTCVEIAPPANARK